MRSIDCQTWFYRHSFALIYMPTELDALVASSAVMSDRVRVFDLPLSFDSMHRA